MMFCPLQSASAENIANVILKSLLHCSNRSLTGRDESAYTHTMTEKLATKNINWGLRRFLHDIRSHRERFRQFIGIAYIVLVSATAQPKGSLFWIGSILVVLGIAIRLWASGHIKKNKILAIDGPYAYVRHPIYVGNITLGLGFSLASGLWWSLPLFVLVLLVFYPHAISREDEKLHRAFGEEWEKWREDTRALIPHFARYGTVRSGNWSFMQSVRQNGEPMIDLFLLFLLYIISSGLH
jgi:protein-S-isoprenylcysteine O-methyltransferase Ste14